MPLLRNPDAEWKSTAVSALYDRYVSIRDERFRYTRYSDDQEELYDCAKDPHEWTNQTGNPQYASDLKRLRASVPSLSEMAPPVPSSKKDDKDD
ncbi:MAG: hypothetical protein BWX88_04484 [Planctomycetes bacterium ADurb.Bin126]|nr:MAG: hypothetical protein BWX88_04484 [Planctomycetes bacterium ADurb.Bin126]HQL73730.1 hypothetical protein [Phycisphaerae bacterium]